MKELILKILNISKEKNVPVDMALDIVRDTDNYSIEELHKAADFFHKYYNVFASARKTGNTSILDEMIEIDCRG